MPSDTTKPDGDDDPLRTAIAQSLLPKGPSPITLDEEPIPEAEFSRWLSPSAALDSLGHHLERNLIMQAVVNRLRLGMIQAAAELAVVHTEAGDEEGQTNFPVPKVLWRATDVTPDRMFWKTGDMMFSTSTSTGYVINVFDWVAFTGIRFEPSGVAALKVALGRKPEAVASDVTADATPAAADNRSQLARAEAERFCHAILAGWPDATQDFAHDKAVLFFPDRRVPRDWFRSILRSIRGSTKPGKKPKVSQ